LFQFVCALVNIFDDFHNDAFSLLLDAYQRCVESEAGHFVQDGEGTCLAGVINHHDEMGPGLVLVKLDDTLNAFYLVGDFFKLHLA